MTDFAIKIPQKDLVRLLRYASNVIATRNTIPVLACTRLTLRADSLSVEATDMDRWFAASIPFQGKPELSRVAVPLTQLRDIVSAMPPDQDVSLSEKAKRLTISSGRSRYVLPLFDLREWPECKGEKDMATFELKPSELRTALEFCAPSISDEETRYYLTGLHFKLEGERLRLASTDGHRLTRMHLPVSVDDQNKGFGEAIIPAPTVEIYSKLLRDQPNDQTVRLGMSEKGTFLELKSGEADIAVYSTLVGGEFPDINRFFNPAPPHRVTVSAAQFEDALNRIAIVTNGKTRQIVIELGADTMNISARSLESSSEGAEQIEGLSIPAPLRIGFNLDYLRTVFQQTSLPEIDMLYSDPSQFAMFVPPGEDVTADQLILVVPQRV